MKFYVGMFNLHHCKYVGPCMVSANRLKRRRSDFEVGEWIMDSGAFTEVTQHGGFRDSPADYASLIARWSSCGDLVAACSQDYMCEPFALAATGRTVIEHQRMTVERYDALNQLVTGTYLMPVLQGWKPADYARHVDMYGERLSGDAWVGVGSVCKRNTSVAEIEDVLGAILDQRPDLRLHGFGLKITALTSAMVQDSLYSSDSMAWSFAARNEGRDPNDWREAARYVERIQRITPQEALPL